METKPTTESAVVCSAQYGRNPDLCYLPDNHDGPHSNRYGCTWSSQDRRGFVVRLGAVLPPAKSGGDRG